jgi:HlyD family secretion protein
MKTLPLQRRTLALIAFLLPLLVLFVYVALRSGPLAPVAVTTQIVETKALSPSLFGIGTVEARYTHKIGPTAAGRLKSLAVQVGDRVKAGQVLGVMEPVDLDARVVSQQAAQLRAEALLKEVDARAQYARAQATRYEQLAAEKLVSEELASTKRQERQIADAALDAAREELRRVKSDYAAIVAQQRNLTLVAPADGLVTVRHVDPGTTVVAGQPVIELIAPDSLWINARLDQASATGLAAGLPARIVLRSRSGSPFAGRVLRVEPVADAVTEEILAKIAFDALPAPLPPVGELAEVTIDLPAVAAAPVIRNAALHRVGEKTGVWKLVDKRAVFSPVTTGASDLDGNVQVTQGLAPGDVVVLYSEKTLSAERRLRVVENIPGIKQ